MKLLEAFDILTFALNDHDKTAIRKNGPAEVSDRWVRNTLHLWEDNVTDILAQDIISVPNHSQYTDGYRLPGEERLIQGVDYSLLHPDNCSMVLIHMYVDYLRGSFIPKTNFKTTQ